MNAIEMIRQCALRSGPPQWTDLSMTQHYEVRGRGEHVPGWSESLAPSDRGIEGAIALPPDSAQPAAACGDCG